MKKKQVKNLVVILAAMAILCGATWAGIAAYYTLPAVTGWGQDGVLAGVIVSDIVVLFGVIIGSFAAIAD